MKVVILNWSQGENDPFTFFSESLAKVFYRCGKQVQILQFTDPHWPEQLQSIHETQGVEFVYTWQGIGTNSLVGKQNQNVWELIQVPVISVHGDHPCYMPDNHLLDTPNSAHWYANADFSRYANAYFRKNSGASVIDFPKIYFEDKLEKNALPVFNFVKNIKHTEDIEKEWDQLLPKDAANVYRLAAEVLKHLIDTEFYVEIHDVMDALIITEKWDWLSEKVNPGIVHHYHRELDYYVRSYRSMRALEELRDIPVHIYGRGWDRYHQNAPKNWTFLPGCDMAESQKLYYSQYGVIDISPSKRLHDRSMRAMANGQGFLSSARLEDSFENLKPYESLFFDFKENSLRARCEIVMQDPVAHQIKSEKFADHYHQLFHFSSFVTKLEQTASYIRARMSQSQRRST